MSIPFPVQILGRFAVAMGIASVAGSANAQVEPIRLTYTAPVECASENEFLQEVIARTARARRAEPNERARAFLVLVARAENKIRGQLEITGLDGTLSTREVTGDTCAEVVSALALTTALSIDPMASVSPASGMQVAVASNEGGQSGVLPAAPAQPSDEAGRAQAHGPSAEQAQSAAHPSARERALVFSAESAGKVSTERPRWAIGGGGQVLAGLAPSAAVGGEVFGAVDAKARGYFAPSFRLSLESVAASAQFPQALGADLIWLLARFEACLLRFPWSTSLFASLCAALQGGVLHSGGASAGLQVNKDVYKPWVAPQAVGRVTWALPGGWFVDGSAGVAVPLIQYHFYYIDGTGHASPSVYDFSPVGAILALGAGYQFP